MIENDVSGIMPEHLEAVQLQSESLKPLALKKFLAGGYILSASISVAELASRGPSDRRHSVKEVVPLKRHALFKSPKAPAA
jgi:hypothetical protein